MHTRSHEQVGNVVFKYQGVAKVGGFSGSDFSSKAYTTDAGYSYVCLKHWNERKDANLSQDALPERDYQRATRMSLRVAAVDAFSGHLSQNRSVLVTAVGAARNTPRCPRDAKQRAALQWREKP